MQDSKLIETPVDKNLSLSCDMCPKNLEKKEKMSRVPYVSVIGSLMYSMICTHPDISYAIRLVS